MWIILETAFAACNNFVGLYNDIITNCNFRPLNIIRFKTLKGAIISCVSRVVTYERSKTLPLSQIVFNIARPFSLFLSLLSWSTAVTIFLCQPKESFQKFLHLFSLFFLFYRSFRDQSSRFRICWFNLERFYEMRNPFCPTCSDRCHTIVLQNVVS